MILAFSTLTLKSFYTRKFDHRHPIKDEVAQMASEPDLGIGGHSTTAASMYTLLVKRRVVNAREMELLLRVPRRGGVRLGLGCGVAGQVEPAASGYVSGVGKNVRSEQQAERPCSPRREGDETLSSEYI